jgi:hypothetical protein
MSRTKKRAEIHHEPNTHEILYSLEAMPKWVGILLQNSAKAYCPFIKWYADKNFYKERTDRISIKQLSKDYALADSAKITQWIGEAYNDILELHADQPELFTGTGIKVNCYCKYFDDATSLVLWFPVIPRMYEEVRIEFVKAKVGVEYFWVEKVTYGVDNDNVEITLYLKGGFANQYRHMLLQRAEFEGVLSLREQHMNPDWENDKELLEYYRR